MQKQLYMPHIDGLRAIAVLSVILSQPTEKRFLHIDNGFNGYIGRLFFINGDGVFGPFQLRYHFIYYCLF